MTSATRPTVPAHHRWVLGAPRTGTRPNPSTVDPWRGFTGTAWRDRVDVADFIRANVRPDDRVTNLVGVLRVSGYAVNFVRLTPEQQRDVLSRTFHEAT